MFESTTSFYNLCHDLSRSSTQSILEREMSFFQVVVKISNFQIFTDFERKKSELFYAINCDPIAHFVPAQKRTA